MPDRFWEASCYLRNDLGSLNFLKGLTLGCDFSWLGLSELGFWFTVAEPCPAETIK